MKRKLIIGGVFVVLAVAVVLLVKFGNPNATQANSGNSVTLSADGKIVMPQNDRVKFTVVSDAPRAARAMTNASPTSSPK